MKRFALVAAVALGACHHVRQPSLGPLPRAAYAHYMTGKLALYREDYARAAEELAAAAAAAPEQPMIAVEQARALAKAKRLDEARAVLAAVRAAWPDHAQVWLASGEVLEKLVPAEAMRAYRRAIELQPDDEHAYLGLARLQEARDAEATLRALIAKVPATVDGRYRLAQRLAARGRLDDAAVQWRAVLERDPDHIDARLDLARALRKGGNLVDAIAQTRSAFDRAGQPMDIAEELFWLLCEADDKQGAIDLLTLLDDERSDADGLATVARLDIGLGRLDEAAAIAKQIAAMDGAADAATLVELRLDLARDDAALEARAATVTPGTPAAAIARGLVAERAIAHGELDKAREIFASLELSDIERAIVAARLRDRAGDRAGALAAVEPIARAHDDQSAALNLAGYLLADDRTRLDDAERYLRRARELAPGDPAVLDSWGWLLLARGRTQDAIRALDHAARFAPLEAEILVHLATAQLAAAAPRAAAATLAKAAALHPSVDVARKIDALRAKIPP